MSQKQNWDNVIRVPCTIIFFVSPSVSGVFAAALNLKKNMGLSMNLEENGRHCCRSFFLIGKGFFDLFGRKKLNFYD